MNGFNDSKGCLFFKPPTGPVKSNIFSKKELAQQLFANPRAGAGPAHWNQRKSFGRAPPTAGAVPLARTVTYFRYVVSVK